MRINGDARPRGPRTVAILGASPLFADVLVTALRCHGVTAHILDDDPDADRGPGTGLPPDVVVLVGTDRAARQVVEDVRWVRSAHTRARVVLLAARLRPAVPQLARQVRARDWITHDLPLPSLVATLSVVAEERVELHRPDALLPATAPDGLTSREIEVLELISAGRNNGQVAASLDISVHTVRTHLQNIRTKLGVASRFAAVVAAQQAGVLRTRPLQDGEPA
jgi:DNA-binding NarL/FixJ family response regulator